MSDLPILTSSRLRSYRACPRHHYLRYTLGYRPVETPDALAFGTGTHLALEAYWNSRKAGLAPDERLAAALATLRAPLNHISVVKLRAMLPGYCAMWDAEDVTVLAVESVFSLPLVNPDTGHASRTWQLGGKLDVLVRYNADGAVAVIEHKTTSEDASEGSTYRERLTLDGQVSVYFDGADSLAQAYGFEQCDRVVYDVLVKLKIRPLLATPPETRRYTKDGRLDARQRENDETPDEFEARCIEAIAKEPGRFYQRATVVRLDVERSEHAFDVWQLAELIRTSERTGKAPRNPDACFRYGQACEFWPVCSKRASLDDATKYRRAENPNEELAA